MKRYTTWLIKKGYIKEGYNPDALVKEYVTTTI